MSEMDVLKKIVNRENLNLHHFTNWVAIPEKVVKWAIDTIEHHEVEVENGNVLICQNTEQQAMLLEKIEELEAENEALERQVMAGKMTAEQPRESQATIFRQIEKERLTNPLAYTMYNTQANVESLLAHLKANIRDLGILKESTPTEEKEN